MKSTILCSLLLLSITLPANAATVRMMGAGNVTCAEWAQLRSSTEYFSAGNWLLGFLSASAWHTGKDMLAFKKADRLFVMVDTYCNDAPGKTIADAAVGLADKMLEKFSPQ